MGCSTPGPAWRNYSITRLQLQDPLVVFGLAETTLIDQGYLIDQRDQTAGLLTALHLDATPADEPASRGRRLSSKRPVRRIAWLRIQPAGETVKIHCKVLVQEQEAETHRMFARERGGRDTPGETPIERDAATTTEQNTIWRTIRRDRATERNILSRVLDDLRAST
jgi:hypothetical protein